MEPKRNLEFEAILKDLDFGIPKEVRPNQEIVLQAVSQYLDTRPAIKQSEIAASIALSREFTFPSSYTFPDPNHLYDGRDYWDGSNLEQTADYRFLKLNDAIRTAFGLPKENRVGIHKGSWKIGYQAEKTDIIYFKDGIDLNTYLRSRYKEKERRIVFDFVED